MACNDPIRIDTEDKSHASSVMIELCVAQQTSAHHLFMHLDPPSVRVQVCSVHDHLRLALRSKHRCIQIAPAGKPVPETCCVKKPGPAWCAHKLLYKHTQHGY